ncbi:CPBP family intramembrane metalloprotease [Virgibacillus sp. MSJ-26]|uniref:CPBP family intramembrane glutamic endopeptidase n=1 Tax=Virgibacillus sp. MSJ-26 TaxID=2841522 RepID=UPI001C111FC7|nr:type II CAAX endopeptidase family protein [Virgibacillus sp. MSJ-26]MBU5466927.1 CPBP family intramembrane metalloprotease [Virgibacillus sp. MSJ-26]
MASSNFRISRLFLYFILVSLFLFVAGNVGRYLIETQDMDRKVAVLLQGMIFTGLTLIVLYVLKRKSPESFKSIGLKGVNSSSKMAIGIALPFILLGVGILTAYLFGGIENPSMNLTTSVIISVLINTITAFMYEAFPEEVFIRGLIFEELQKKFRFFVSLLLQPLIFICVPITVIAMESIFFDRPFAITIDYFILLFAFGIALQLYRIYTGSLWMNIIFHIVYLEVVRYISLGGAYESGIALLEFDETFEGFMSLYLSFLFIVIFSIVVLSFLILNDRRKISHNRSM